MHDDCMKIWTYQREWMKIQRQEVFINFYSFPNVQEYQSVKNSTWPKPERIYFAFLCAYVHKYSKLKLLLHIIYLVLSHSCVHLKGPRW